MRIYSPTLRKAYATAKAANIAARIKEHIEQGKTAEVPEGDPLGETPPPQANVDHTDPRTPTEGELPRDPEFNTDQIVSGTGKGPVIGTNRSHL